MTLVSSETGEQEMRAAILSSRAAGRQA